MIVTGILCVVLGRMEARAACFTTVQLVVQLHVLLYNCAAWFTISVWINFRVCLYLFSLFTIGFTRNYIIEDICELFYEYIKIHYDYFNFSKSFSLLQMEQSLILYNQF